MRGPVGRTPRPLPAGSIRLRAFDKGSPAWPRLECVEDEPEAVLEELSIRRNSPRGRASHACGPLSHEEEMMRGLVASLVATLILASCSSGESSGSPSTSAPPPPSATSSAIPVSSLGVWQRVADEGAFVDPLGPTDVVALATGPAGAIAVGQGPLGAIAWASRDGISWRRAVSGGPDGDGFTQVAALGDAWVAAAIGAGGGEAKVSTYVSDDGTAWRPTATFGSRHVGVRLVETPGAVIAMAGGVAGASISVTTNGETWSEQAAAALAGGWVLGVKQHDGVVVAVGSTTTQPPEARLWTAPEGKSWTKVDLPAGARHPVTVSADSSGFLLVNTWLTTAGPAAWRSTDGRHWSPWTAYTPPDDVIDFWAFPASADAGGDLYVATTVTATSPVQHDIWVSRNGHDWVRQQLVLALDASAPAGGGEIVDAIGTSTWDPLAVYVNDVIQIGPHLLAAGSIGSEGAIWIAPPVAPAGANPSPTPPPCASPPVDLRGLIAVPGRERRACLGDRSIVLSGVVTATSPSSCRFQRQDSLACRPGIVIALAPGPRVWNLRVTMGPELVDVEPARLVGQSIELLARYGHPAADGCGQTDGRSSTPSSADAMRDACRALLVATEIRSIGEDSQR